MKRILLFTALCFMFSANAQIRNVYNSTYNWGSGGVPKSLNVFNGRIFFTAQDHVNSEGYRCIWVGQGVSTDLVPIYNNIYTSSSRIYNSFPELDFFELNSEAYMLGKDSGSDRRIYKLDSPTGTSYTTTEIMNVTSLTGSAASRFIEPAYLNNKIVFTPYDATGGVGVEPYLIDLTNSSNNGVLLDINNGAVSSDPRYFTVLNNKILFSATDATNGRELWETDGTTAGTQLFANINVGYSDSNPDNFTLLGSNMLFSATNLGTGREIFITNGTVAGTTLLKDINSGNVDSSPMNLTNVGSEVYFSADNGSVGQELWKTDGTATGTILIKDINSSGDSNPNNFLKIGSTIYFTANDGVNGIELWKTDGTSAGTVLVKNIFASSSSSNPRNLVEYNGKLYFVADDAATNGSNVWVSDGTSAGTVKLTTSIANGSSYVVGLALYGNELYFNTLYSVFAYMDPALATNSFELNENTISLYPNPSNEVFQLNTDLSVEKVEMYSLQGQLVKSFSAQNQYNVSDLAKGIYFVKVTTDNGNVTKRLIIE